MKDKYFTIDEVKAVLRMHPTECVFELDAPHKIFERLSVKTRAEWLPFFGYTAEKHDEFKRAWQLSEIYCPHEGIDRRNEYGM